MLSYTGNDLIEFAGRNLTDFANGDVAVVTFPNEISSTSAGKNGNVVVARNEQGRVAELSLRIVRGSPDDKFINSLCKLWNNSPMDYEPVSASLTKMIKVDGSVTNDIMSLKFGFPTKTAPEVKVNVEGDVEQAVSIYSFRFVINDGRSLA